MRMSDWPAWAQDYAKRRARGDVGVGDTMKRCSRCHGADCEANRQKFNERYPYDAAGNAVPSGKPAKPLAQQLAEECPYGFGTVVASGISFTTLGCGELIAAEIAKVMGKANCRCRVRARCMNKIVPDWREVGAAGWVLKAPALLACLVERKAPK